MKQLISSLQIIYRRFNFILSKYSLLLPLAVYIFEVISHFFGGKILGKKIIISFLLRLR